MSTSRSMYLFVPEFDIKLLGGGREKGKPPLCLPLKGVEGEQGTVFILT
ncbi:hypothetical protein WEU38_03395 [Cyanobacterium aponinum AL20118]|uniref:Uncharacterized protein n=1 Tax=Cyanobacterium aponinum AL20115 TaxID=3090662 RepID=A0AAF0ZFS4_9CHRO|nr:hypothetical protein [Cyanobacterium aponinum]WPF89337.1 hypothetical protein SAY89_03410 [Cyanobacterium aponinum AL20115]